MSRSRLNAFFITVLAVAVGIATNIATSRLPAWLQPYVWLSWPILGLLVVLFIAISVLEAHEKTRNALPASQSRKDKTETLLQEDRQTIGNTDPIGSVPRGFRREDWGEVPHTGNFCGREEELTRLKQWVASDRCRIVAVLGIGGVGKSSLASKAAELLKDGFAYVFWRSLQNAPPVENILKNCIQFLSDQQQINLPEDIDSQLVMLVQYLQERRCLLILDNVESILQSGNYVGQYREGFEGYGKLLRRVGESEHQSCLVLTSREKPKEVAFSEGKTSSVRSLELTGLGQVEGRQILQETGLSGTDEALAAITQLYSGNPLALKMVSALVRLVFDGDAAEFLKARGVIVGGVHDLLDQQYHRLSEREKEIMYWLAIEREPIPLNDLREDIIHLTTNRELVGTLDSLRSRYLIESRGAAYFTLQPVIMEYMTEKLIDQAYEEINTSTIRILESYALIKAQTKDFVRDSQVRVILMPIIERLLNTQSRADIENSLKNLLSVLQKTRAQKPGYAAGNILNLLVHFGFDLRGYDFSGLVVWQAYLQGVILHDVNFAASNLAKSVFTDSFATVFSVAFSPNGELLAAGTASGEIQLWQVTSGSLLHTYQGHTNWVRTVAFNPKGDMLASGSDDQTVRLWDVASGKSLKILQGHGHRVWSLAFSPNSNLLASGSDDQTLRLWDVASGKCLKVLREHTSRVRSVAFSPNGDLLASGSDNETVRLWNVASGECFKALQGHIGWVWSVAFSPNGDLLASGSDDQTVRLWDIASGECLRTLQGHTSQVRAVAFSPRGDTLASGSDDQTLRLWNVASGECLKTLQGHTNWVRSVAFSSKNDVLASASDDQTVRIWDVARGECLKTLQGHTNWVRSVAFSPSGDVLASGSDDQTVRLWDVARGECLKTLRGHTNRVRSVAFSPNGDLLASASDDQTVRLWDATRGKSFKILRGHTNWVRSVAFSLRGDVLASGSDDQTLRLWDVASGECLKTLRGHTNWIWSVAFSPNGDLLASGSEDQTLRLWDAAKGKSLKILRGHTNRVRSVAFNPNNDLLASGSDDQTVRIWDIASGKCLKTLRGHTNWVWSVAFSPKGDILISGSNDQTVRIWDVASGECLKTLEGHTDRVWSVAFSPLGATLVSGSQDGTIKLWDLRTYQCLKTLRSDSPYERMNITGVMGLTDAQKAGLRALGAIEL